VTFIFFCNALAYDVTALRTSTEPILSSVRGTSAFEQTFNPSWIEPTAGTNFRSGLLIRSQNCTSPIGTCVRCSGPRERASVLAFSEYSGGRFTPLKNSSIVFGPSSMLDTYGTEDPRLAFNKHDNLYYLFYTAYNGSGIELSLATSPDPTSPKRWSRLGPIFNLPGSKSGALLIMDTPPHYLFWGDSIIQVTTSSDPKKWASLGVPFLKPRPGSWDSRLVESGPPPLKLSTGDFIFFYNSADDTEAYHPAWVILDKNDPTKIVQRAAVPLLTPTLAWETGVAPFTCNVGNVIFLEAAYPLGGDQFMVFYGGADAVVGSAVVTVVV